MLQSICQQNWKTQQWPQDWKRSVFIPIPKKVNAKECSNYDTISFISHDTKVRLKILQARLHQYVNCKISRYISWIYKRQRSQRGNCQHPLDHRKKQENSGNNIYICFIKYSKAFDFAVDHSKLWKFLKRWEHKITLPVSGETCLQVKKQHLDLDMEKRTGSNMGKEYIKTVYFTLFI